MNKRIERQRGERGFEYDAFLDGQYIGTFRTRDAAQAELDRLAYENLTHQQGGEVAETPRQVVETPNHQELDDLQGKFPTLVRTIANARKRLREGGIVCWWEGETLYIQQGKKTVHRATENSQTCTCAASVTCWARPLAMAIWQRERICTGPTMRERRENAPLIHPRRGRIDNDLFKQE